MSSQRPTGGDGVRGFTLTEVLALVLLVVLLMMILMPTSGRPRINASRIKCVNNLKNVGLAMRIFSDDHEGKFPANVSSKEGGMLDMVEKPDAAMYLLRCLSNELSTPKIIFCPGDKARFEATNFNVLKTQNVGYFVSLNAVAATNDDSGFLAGDRQLGVPGFVTRSTLAVSSNSAGALHWGKEPHKFQGNLTIADGSVLQLSDHRLQAQAAMLVRTNILAFP